MDLAIRLTTREVEVLELLAAGHTYTQVSERLGVSANTVASHVKSIYRKLGVHSGRGAVWRALELRLIGDPEAAVEQGQQEVISAGFDSFSGESRNPPGLFGALREVLPGSET